MELVTPFQSAVGMWYVSASAQPSFSIYTYVGTCMYVFYNCSTQLCVVVGFNNVIFYLTNSYVHCVCNVVLVILSADKSAVPQNGESKEICALIGIVHLLAG